MNGKTDEPDETVSLADLQIMLSFAEQKHLARLTFWAINRDRACAGADQTPDSCSGVSQQPYAYTQLIARYHG
jgi:hypothetical protein